MGADARHTCPGCGAVDQSMPLPKAIKIGAQPRYWGWSDDWSVLPRLHGALTARGLTEPVLAQLKRPVAAIPGPIRRLVEGLLVVVICVIGIPFLIVGIFMVMAFEGLWFYLARRLVRGHGAAGCLGAGRHPARSTRTARLRSLEQSALLQSCGQIFDPRSQRVIPLGHLQDELYQGSERALHID